MFEQKAIESVSILIVLIFLGMFLRKAGLFKDQDSGLFVSIITKITLPALIIHSLSTTEFSFDKLLIALVMIISIVLCALIVWGLGSLFKLSRARQGGIILASSFPSSAFLGYALVEEMFAGNEEAIADAAIASELGVGLMLFTFGVFIAIHFGNQPHSKGLLKKEMLKFLYSPIFISILLGIGFSFISLPKHNVMVEGFYKTLQIVSNANTFLVALTVGVMLHFKHLKNILGLLLIVILLKLFLQPVFSYLQALWFQMDELSHRILVLESAMPTAAMTAVFARKYGDDAELTSIVVFASFLTSCISMIMMLFVLN